MLHKDQERLNRDMVPDEGQSGSLCSNRRSKDCPSLGFNPNDPLISKKMALDYLANLLVRAYLDKKRANYAKENHTDNL